MKAEKRIDLGLTGRDDIVVQAAKIIAPDWFGPPWIDANTGKEPESCRVRREYEQSKAYRIAFDVLKLASSTMNLAETLIDVEVADWKRIGIDAPEVRPIVTRKYTSEGAK